MALPGGDPPEGRTDSKVTAAFGARRLCRNTCVVAAVCRARRLFSSGPVALCNRSRFASAHLDSQCTPSLQNKTPAMRWHWLPAAALDV